MSDTTVFLLVLSTSYRNVIYVYAGVKAQSKRTMVKHSPWIKNKMRYFATKLQHLQNIRLGETFRFPEEYFKCFCSKCFPLLFQH